jgi:hypothetical protein
MAKPAKSRKPLIAAAAGLAVLLIGGFVYFSGHSSNKSVLGTQTDGTSINKNDMTIAFYAPSNLPDNYKVSAYRLVKKDVVTYSISNKNNDSFYVSVQPKASDAEQANFERKLSKVVPVTTDAGTGEMGVSGTTLVGSIKTNGGSWVIISSTATNSTQDMQTIMRSFKPVSL